jgi:hypothetical protein
MTFTSLQQALAALGLPTDKDGAYLAPEGGTLGLHAAHDGAHMAIARIERIQLTDGMLVASTQKKETYVVPQAAVFAVATDASNSGTGRQRAGFG